METMVSLETTNHKKVLLTTPDYPPKLGGLSTFTINIENCLKQLGIDYELFVWNSPKHIRDNKEKYQNFDIFLNIHYMGGFFLNPEGQNINFIHGSEVSFYSPNIMKRVIKKILKVKMLNYIQGSTYNCFISEYTKLFLESRGLKSDYSRDLIFHNCINLDTSTLVNKSWSEGTIYLCSIVRDVPHKNLNGCVKFAKELALISGRKVKLYLTAENRWVSNLIEIESIQDISDEKREEIYKKCHFNLLFSLDHSKIGFFEGFGLTVLESGKYGTPSIVLPNGGLKESVHNKETGVVLPSLASGTIRGFYHSMNDDYYRSLSKNCYEHIVKSHSVSLYNKLLSSLLGDNNG